MIQYTRVELECKRAACVCVLCLEVTRCQAMMQNEMLSRYEERRAEEGIQMGCFV